MRRALPLAILLIASPAFADVSSPYGYRYVAPVEESLAVAAFRVSLRGAVTDAERDRWMRPVPRCRNRTRRGFRYRMRRCSSTRADIRHAVGDRLVRWLMPRLLVARGDTTRARVLVELAPLRRTRDVAAAHDALAGDDPALVLARRALEEDSIEALGRQVGELAALALAEGVDRPLLLEGLRGLMILLTEPERLLGRFTVDLEQPTQGPAWTASYGRIRAAEPCLREEHERTGWGIEARVVMRFVQGRAFVATSADGELGACIARALEAPSRHEPPEGTEAVAVLRFSRAPEALFSRPDVGS